jgi:hypothetical protein
MSDETAFTYQVVRNFLSEADASVVSRYMEYALKGALYTNRGEGTGPSADDPSRYARYADPLMEVMLVDSREAVEEIVGCDLLPTYSYSRVYVEGDELERHVDRPSCEYSVTVNVACDGEPWPIWMQYGDAEPAKFTLNSGDAVVYKGCDVHHWRNKMEHTRVNAQFMLHYVNKDGPYSEYQWDKRPGAGHPSVWRS